MPSKDMKLLAVLLSLAVGYGGVMAESPRSNLRSEIKALGDEPEVTETSTKGSLLVFPKIELRWAESEPGEWVLIQDTFIELTNDYPEDVVVQMYYVDGDQPSSWIDVMIELTANEPTYWSAASGLPKGVSPFQILHPGFPPGRPCDDGSDERCLGGYLLAWATDEDGYPLSWNHLTGSSIVLHYRDDRAWESAPWAFQCVVPFGSLCEDVPGEGKLNLDGTAYESVPEKLLLDFYAVGADPFGLGSPPGTIPVDTNLTLLPLMIDLRQDGDGPIMSKANFDIWNMNEWKFSGTHRCIFGWDEELLSRYDLPNHFLRDNLQTDKGKARIDGVASAVCGPESTEAPFLGVSARLLTYEDNHSSIAGSGLTGTGVELGHIMYDAMLGPDPQKRRDISDTRMLLPRDKQAVRERDDAQIQRDREPKALQDRVHRLSTSRKGSLLIFPKVEVKWDVDGTVVQDTFIELSNDYPEDVSVRIYLVVGDVNNAWGSNRVQLTMNEPSYWSVLTGMPKGVTPFSNFIPFRSPDDDPHNPGGTRLRGHLLAWAVNNVGAGQEVVWNHLSGKATLVNSATKISWQYKPYSFRALDQGGSVHPGDQTGTPMVLNLDGEEFDGCFDRLVLDFFATDSEGLSRGQDSVVTIDTDLTLLPVDIDLRTIGNTGPTTTKATFDIWNMNEWMFTGTFRCVTRWDQSLLSNYDDPNHFRLENLQADKGKARIDGNASMFCPDSEDVPLVGVEMRLLTFDQGRMAATGGALAGMGIEAGIIILGCESDEDCDDGIFCNGQELCVDGMCMPGTPPDCDDGADCTEDSCNAESDRCEHIPHNSRCDDNEPCTVDRCVVTSDPPGGWCDNEFVDCDDGNPCTVDFCDPETLCVGGPFDGNPCSQDEDCLLGSGTCEAIGIITCRHEERDCDDGDLCTVDACDSDTGNCVNEPVECDDGDPCTEDSCDNAECLHEQIPGCGVPGRMTGGGSVFVDRMRFTHGFELHCDPNDGPNRLQINWSGGHGFYLTSLDVAYCMDDPNINEAPPDAGLDTLIGSGTGRLNGMAEATITFKFTDMGEPGKTVDLAEFTIVGPESIVVSGPLSKGNHQAHSD